MIPKMLQAKHAGLFLHGVQWVLKKKEKTVQMEDKRRSGKPIKEPTKEDEQYLKVLTLRNRKRKSR